MCVSNALAVEEKDAQKEIEEKAKKGRFIRVEEQKELTNTGKFSLTTAGFSGFIDAEGCFSIYHNEKTNSIELRFIIDQKNEYLFLNDIKEKFNAGRIDIRKDCANMYRFVLGLKKNLISKRTKEIDQEKKEAFEKLFVYLDRFPLKTNKHFDYVRFKKVGIRLLDTFERKEGPNRPWRRFKNLISNLKQ